MKIKGVFTIQVLKPNGVEIIRDALKKAYEKLPENVSVRIYTIGAPRYVVEVTATDYKIAERVLSNIVKTVTKAIESHGGIVEFNRER